MDHRHLQRRHRREIGQQAGQAGGEHGLAGAGRADQQDVVSTRGGDLQSALGGFHAAHLGQVGRARQLGHAGGVGRGEHLGAAEMVDQAEQVGRRQHLDAAGPGGLAALGGRADQPERARRRGDRRRQHPGHRVQRAVQREFAEGGEFPDFLAGQHVHGGQHGERDRQVEMAAFLQQVGRGEVDQHPFWRQREAHGGQGGAHPLARLAHRLVRQADHQEGGNARGYLHLHFHRHRLDAGEGEGLHAGDGHCGLYRPRQPGSGMN